MKAEEFFNQKPEPIKMLGKIVETLRSESEASHEFLAYLLNDAGIDDDEIDETIAEIIKWRNKSADSYHKQEMEKVLEVEPEKLEEIVTKIAYKQYGEDQVEDLFAKMGILLGWYVKHLKSKL